MEKRAIFIFESRYCNGKCVKCGRWERRIEREDKEERECVVNEMRNKWDRSVYSEQWSFINQMENRSNNTRTSSQEYGEWIECVPFSSRLYSLMLRYRFFSTSTYISVYIYHTQCPEERKRERIILGRRGCSYQKKKNRERRRIRRTIRWLIVINLNSKLDLVPDQQNNSMKEFLFENR